MLGFCTQWILKKLKKVSVNDPKKTLAPFSKLGVPSLPLPLFKWAGIFSPFETPGRNRALRELREDATHDKVSFKHPWFIFDLLKHPDKFILLVF